MLGIATALSAQDNGGGNASNYLVYIIMAASVLIFFVLVIQVADNLLAIEAKRMGISRKDGSFSLFPSISELFPKKTPDYTGNQPVMVLKRGHDILLEGEADKSVDDSIAARTFALQPPNFTGIRPIPKMLVEAGQEVMAGDPLFYDKGMPDIMYCAPVSGEVIAVNRGDKRSIVEVVILADKEIKYREAPAFDLEKSSREELVKFLAGSGVWPMFRQRPFNVVADLEEEPRDIFISTFDTAPLAPDLSFVVEGRGEAFQKGLDVLNKLTSGKVYLGLDARSPNPPSKVFTEAQGVEKHWFRGKHPAGNVGIQIHHVRPIGMKDKVWTVNVQDVITLGALFTEGRFNAERVVAITGAELKAPRYVRTFIGANIKDLIGDNLKNEHVRYISGDVLSGESKDADSFINFHDDQLTVVEEGDYFEMFGWLFPGKLRPTVSRTFPNFLFPNMEFRADTNTHGEKRAFVVTGEYEKLLPMDIFPQQLMKSILINDFEQMEGLGIYELVEEDVALCEFACTSKQPLQQILRQGLETMREQG